MLILGFFSVPLSIAHVHDDVDESSLDEPTPVRVACHS